MARRHDVTLPGRRWGRMAVRPDVQRGPGSGGAQVAAEAMPYITHRRPECNTGRPHPSARRERSVARRRRRIAGPGVTSVEPGRGPWSPTLRGWTRRRGIPGPSGPCHGHRSARRPERRLGAVRPQREPARCGRSASPARLPAAGQRLRRRSRGAVVVGGAILALRPSVRAGGYVGTIDLLVVDPAYDAERITDALLEELLRSASNKGCTVVEAVPPDDPARPRALAADGLRARRSRASNESWPRRVPPRVPSA